MDTTNQTGFFWLRRSKKVLFLVVLTVFFTSLVLPANASKGGQVQLNNSYAVGISFKNSGISEICSGALISPTFIATAGHCIINDKGEKNTDFIFTAPGTALDDPINPITQPKVLKFYYPTDFNGQIGDELNDIAFIQLDKPMVSKGWIKVATESQLNSISENQILSAIGYGRVFETSEPYSRFPREYELNWSVPSNLALMTELTSKDNTACSGDSGGPVVIHQSDGTDLLIGTMHSAAKVINGCGGLTDDGKFHMQVTLISKYLALIQSELDKSFTISTPKPTASPIKPISYKITCIKGKTKKYVTGTNPKCPSGYKQISKVKITK